MRVIVMQAIWFWQQESENSLLQKCNMETDWGNWRPGLTENEVVIGYIKADSRNVVFVQTKRQYIHYKEQH